MGQFNVKEFLLEPVNEGKTYKPGRSCGCIKYAFDKACNNILAYTGYRNKKIQNMMDIAETILVKGYPQKAKLFVASCMEKYFDGCCVEKLYIGVVNPFPWSGTIIPPYKNRFTKPIVDKVKTRIKETANV